MSRSELLQGTLDMMVLKALSAGPMHGYAIASWIKRHSDEFLVVEEGALYPALYRMARKKWVVGELGLSENNRKAKYYQLTSKGRSELNRRHKHWTRYSMALGKLLATQA